MIERLIRRASKVLSSRPELHATLGVGALALAIRLLVVVLWSREPVWDGHYYDFGAQRIAAGLGYSDDVIIRGVSVWHPWCHYPVGYSGFLALVYMVFGAGMLVAPAANAVLGSLATMLTHRIALRWLSPGRALVAAMLCALHLEFIAYTPVVMTSVLDTVGPLLAFWMAHRFRAQRQWAALLGAGIVLGLFTLVRPQTLLLAPGIALAVTPSWRDWKRLGSSIIFATVATLIPVVPWTIRNCRVMDGCALVSTNGGWNLAIGALPRATGRFETLRAQDGCPVVTGQVQQDRCWAEVGVQAIRQDPQRWLALIPKKLEQCFDHASFPMGYLGEADPGTWTEERKKLGRGVMTSLHGVLLSLTPFAFIVRSGWTRRSFLRGGLVALTAAVLAWAWLSEPPTFWLLAVFVGVVGFMSQAIARRRSVGVFGAWMFLALIVTHAVFFGEDRYHVPLIPWICIFVASALRRHDDARDADDAASAG